ncbi:MAG: DUF3780 domain-containing protein [Methylobacter sp.]|nr:DUF3780 domain-containing protein [Methylobacter sp.]
MTTRKKEAASAKTIVHPTLGFGVPATSNPHHFIVEIPRNNTGTVSIVENLGLQSHDHAQSLIARVILERPRWTAIRSEVQRAFNVQLKERNLKTSAWKVGANPVDRLLGKELCVLAWAIEGMEEGLFPIAVRNWLALRPEERWWLFGMTAITTGGVNDGDRGWRLALRHALGDVAQSELFKPRSSQTVTQETAKDTENGTFSLFDFEL